MKKTICFLLILILLSCMAVFAQTPKYIEAVSSDGQRLIYYLRTDENGEQIHQQIDVYLNDEKITFANPTYLFDVDTVTYEYQATMLPLRELCERLAYTIDWDPQTHAITISDHDLNTVLALTPSNNFPSRMDSKSKNVSGSIHVVNIDGHYYVNLFGIENYLNIKCEGKWETTAKIYAAMPLTAQEKASPPPILSEYPSGIHKVGVTIPAGDYLLEANGVFGACILSTYLLPTAPHEIDYLMENPFISTREGGIGSSVRFSSFLKGGMCRFRNEYAVHLTDGVYFEAINCVARPLPAEAITDMADTVIKPGAYRVGTDMQKRTYVLIKTGEKPTFDCSRLSVFPFGDYKAVSIADNHTIVDIDYDGFLHLNDCMAYLLGTEPSITGDGSVLQSGTYKIGTHIPSGAYRIAPVDPAQETEYLLSKEACRYSPRMFDQKNPEDYLFLEEGQYLYLHNATLDLTTRRNFKKTLHANGCMPMYEYVLVEDED